MIKKKIIFILFDCRDAKLNNQGKLKEEDFKPLYQVYKTTYRNYKPGQYITLKLNIKPYCNYKGKILYLTEDVLAQVISVRENVISVNIIKEVK